MVDANLLIYEKYHFRGQAPRSLGNGSVTKLARYEQNEGKLSQRDKYKDLYFAEYVKDPMGKIGNLLHCCICSEKIKCPQNASNLLDFSNFFRHLQSKHTTELTVEDQEKKHGTNSGTRIYIF